MKPQAEIENLARHAREAAAARRAVEGSLIGAGILGVNALDAAAQAAAMAVRVAALTGGDVAGVARSAVLGAIDAAKELTVDPVETAAAAARGALRGAREADAHLLEEVRSAVSGVIGGVRVAVTG